MIAKGETERLAKAQQDYGRERERIWVERIGAGLTYRRALRDIDERLRATRESRDREVLEAVEAGGSYREVAAALGLSHSRVQQIVGSARS